MNLLLLLVVTINWATSSLLSVLFLCHIRNVNSTYTVQLLEINIIVKLKLTLPRSVSKC